MIEIYRKWEGTIVGTHLTGLTGLELNFTGVRLIQIVMKPQKTAIHFSCLFAPTWIWIVQLLFGMKILIENSIMHAVGWPLSRK